MTNTRAIGRNKFPIETRPYGDARRPFAVIKCSKCHRDEAVTIKPDEGVQKAKIYFRAKGWLIGSSRSTDVCPTCRNQKPRMNGVSTPSRRRAAYNRIEAKLAKVEETEIIEVVLGPMAGHLAPLAKAMKLNMPALVEEPARPVRVATEAPKPRQSRRSPPVSRPITPLRTAEREASLGLVPDPPRGSPSPAERRAILDALENHYDVDRGLYRGKSGDALLSEKLNLPRAWIAELRDQFMGGPDKNEAGVAKIGQLDEAIALAEAAITNLTEMAVRAEEIAGQLKAARTKLLG